MIDSLDAPLFCRLLYHLAIHYIQTSMILLIAFCCLLCLPTTAAFSVTSPGILEQRRRRVASQLSFGPLSSLDQEIGLWTAAFATSHIGMSAIRGEIIQALGQVADTNLHLVHRGWKLPDIWPGDEAGQEIFPTAEIAGRQLYRIVYTIISFGTLGSAFVAYLNALHQQQEPVAVDIPDTYFWISVVSWAISIASLVNPSPLSLVPVYEQDATVSASSTTRSGFQRNDSKKLQARGLTRITRHPLILPVVPWTSATALSLGGQPRELLFFGGLAIYAICGCAAQDLRVVREEGSVGTVFVPDGSLQAFFDDTSFIPFGAVIGGRQSLSEIVQEVPWWAFGVGIGIGYPFQHFLLDWLSSQSN